MSYKVFSNGSVLNASELNEFLMNQSVIAFSNATARSSAITSPIEGMITYLEDSNSYQSWDGSRWVGLVPQSPNAIINGAFEINQRGFTSNTTSGFTFDRLFNSMTDGTVTATSQQFIAGSPPVSGFELSRFMRVAISGQTATNARASIAQLVENVATLAGQTVTVSFYAKAATGTPKIAVELEQNFGTGGSTTVQHFVGQVDVSGSMARHSLTFALPNLSGKTVGPNSRLQLTLFMSAGSDFNARTGSLGIQSNTFDIWGVQLEAGPVATPFRRNANSLQGELAACQRYYERIGRGSIGRISTTTVAEFYLRFNEKRVVPTISLSRTNPQFYDPAVGTKTGTASSVSLPVSSGVNGAVISINGYTGLVPGNAVVIINDEFVELSSEL
jgi:hypothetical protein